MPFQSIFINAFQNDIENNQLWQQTAAALQSNKFVQVSWKKKTKILFRFFKNFLTAQIIQKNKLAAYKPFMYSINVSCLASSWKEKW